MRPVIRGDGVKGEIGWVRYLKESMGVLGIDTEVDEGDDAAEVIIGRCGNFLRKKVVLAGEEKKEFEVGVNGLRKPKCHWSLKYCPFSANFVYSCTRESFNPATEVTQSGEVECWMCGEHEDTPRETVTKCSNRELRELVQSVVDCVGVKCALYDDSWCVCGDVSGCSCDSVCENVNKKTHMDSLGMYAKKFGTSGNDFEEKSWLVKRLIT